MRYSIPIRKIFLFYFLGVPGTGKTATVKQVMRYMVENKEDFPEFDFYEINGMRLTCPEQVS
jgi:Cdc6-like AAA superfamily ATPase